MHVPANSLGPIHRPPPSCGAGGYHTTQSQEVARRKLHVKFSSDYCTAEGDLPPPIHSQNERFTPDHVYAEDPPATKCHPMQKPWARPPSRAHQLHGANLRGRLLPVTAPSYLPEDGIPRHKGSLAPVRVTHAQVFPEEVVKRKIRDSLAFPLLPTGFHGLQG